MTERLTPGSAKGGGPGKRSQRWSFGRFVLDEASRELRRDGVLVKLEPKPLDLLLLLLRQSGELVAKRDLIDTIWVGRVVTENVIARCVAKLREALGDEGASRIVTVHGYGYRFVGDCRLENMPTSLPTAATPRSGDRPPGRPNWMLETALDDLGRVWRARHRTTGQWRAFKFAHDSDALAALKREIAVFRILARDSERQIPVVEILDWNLEQHPYFIEMRYEPLGNLRRWLESRGGASALPLAQRLELAARMADAVATAHALGVLHKDLKPDNILLRNEDGDEIPQVRLADFGSAGVDASILEKLKLTQIGLPRVDLVAGDGGSTSLYVAPELLAGAAPTTRSDIYALGVMAYQLAAGDLLRPLAPGWEREIDDPLLQEDIASAADFNPAHRLGDAAQLALRLRNLPARRETRRQRQQLESERAAALKAGEAAQAAIEKLRHRRRWQAAVLASLCAGFMVSTALYLRARASERQTQIEAGTLRAVNSFVNDDLLGAANPYVPGGGRSVTIASILDTAASKLQTRFARQAQIRARLTLTIARAYTQLGLEEQARDTLRAALGNAPAAGIEDDADLRSIMSALAALELRLADPGGARALYRRLDRWTQARLPADDPERLSLRRALAWERFENGYFAQAQSALEALRADVRRERPESADLLLQIDANLVEVYVETQRWALARRTVDDVLTRVAIRHGADSVDALWPTLSKVYILRMLEQWDDAEALTQGVLRKARDRLGENHPLTIACYNHLGTIRMRQGRYDEARRYFETALARYRTVFGDENYRTRRMLTRLGEVDIHTGHAARARRTLADALASSIKTLGEDHPHSIDIARLLAEAEAADGELAQAEARLRHVIALAPERMPNNNNRTAHAEYALARVLLSEQRPADALPHLRQAHRLFAHNFGARHSLSIRTAELIDSARAPEAAGHPPVST
ncbi:tetratricopeptide repeat protein [Solimonas terrae]|uniref:non-specific serine/threonine protein kinase n=1 Tax=Solimonas terrae TaxID=1396819 RepID=A0A6M2BS01_9GAMM|nr:tetratricopeptide repeat protein [Solimonas terrae]NGY05110.1 tetratricopeptide repeat protein [Solimonas terrae]